MRKFRLASLAVAAALLVGCQSPYTDYEREGGTTPAAAEQLLLSIEGITRADYRTVEWHSPGEGGLGASWGMDIYLAVTIDPEYHIADPVEFLDFLARTAWSVNDHYPKGSVLLLVTGGIAHYFDWLPAVNEVFGSDDLYLRTFSSSDYRPDADSREMPIIMSASEYGEAFGRWPSEPVKARTGLLLPGAPEYPTVPAIEALSAEPFRDQLKEQDCYYASVKRMNGYDGTYVLPIELELVSGATRVEATLEKGDYGHFFCFDTGERPSSATVHARAEGVPGYEATELSVQVVDR